MTGEFIIVAEADSILPGHGRTVAIHGREFAIWNLDGTFHCIDDHCPHRGGPLGAGSMTNGVIYCPLHGWGFDLKTGTCASRPDRPVKTYQTRVMNGHIQIQIPPSADLPPANDLPTLPAGECSGHFPNPPNPLPFQI